MPQLNQTGPDSEGPGSGRALGRCRNNKQSDESFSHGRGMAKRRNSGGGEGRGKRKKYHQLIIKQFSTDEKDSSTPNRW